MRGLVAALLLAASASQTAIAQRMTEFYVGSNTFPWGITVERFSGNLAYTHNFGNKLGFMTTAGVVQPDYPLPNANSSPTYICQGTDGSLWFTLPGINHIGRYGIVMDFKDGAGFSQYKEYSIPTASSNPFYIASASDGGVVATELDGGKLIRITYDNVLTEITPPSSAGGTYYVDGSSPGWIYFTQHLSSTVGWYLPFYPLLENCHLDPCDVTASSSPTSIVRGRDHNLWVLENNTNKVRRGDPGPGSVSFTIPTAGSGPRRLINGPDGNLWFLETAKNKLARVTLDGVITEYDLPATPQDMVLGPDGNLWITEPLVNKLLRFTPAVPGDADGDGTPTLSDVFYLINFLFAGGPAPKF
jgi:virginiamycin B lyase